MHVLPLQDSGAPCCRRMFSISIRTAALQAVAQAAHTQVSSGTETSRQRKVCSIPPSLPSSCSPCSSLPRSSGRREHFFVPILRWCLASSPPSPARGPPALEPQPLLLGCGWRKVRQENQYCSLQSNKRQGKRATSECSCRGNPIIVMATF